MKLMIATTQQEIILCNQNTECAFTNIKWQFEAI